MDTITITYEQLVSSYQRQICELNNRVVELEAILAELRKHALIDRNMLEKIIRKVEK